MSKESAAAQPSPRYKPHPKYKDSGVEWLGEIPVHWEVKRLKHLTLLNPEALPEETDPTLEMIYVDIGGVDGLGHIVEREPLTFVAAPSRARRLVRNGDVIVSTVRTYLRAIAPINDPDPGMVVSTGFAVVRPKDNLATGYAAYALRAPYFVERVVANSKGVSFPAINESEMATYELSVPPEPEQRAIAAFLDRETARIDALVAKKERLIELLQEKRSALITHVVTKGLDPNMPRKNSGVGWLGQFPAHWQMKRLKFAATLQTGLTLGKDYAERQLETRPYLRVANVQDGYLDLADITEISVPLAGIERYELKPGDVLMTEGGDFDKLGRGSVWEGQIEGCLHQNHVFAVRPNPSLLLSPYLAALMTSNHGKHYFTSTSQQTTNLATTNATKLMNFMLLLPAIQEQEQILQFLELRTARLDALITKVRDGLEHLKDYRTALISAAVTGKIDVREEVA